MALKAARPPGATWVRPWEKIQQDNRQRAGDRRQWSYGGEDAAAELVRTSRDRGCLDLFLKSGDDVKPGRQQLSQGIHLRAAGSDGAD